MTHHRPATLDRFLLAILTLAAMAALALDQAAAAQPPVRFFDAPSQSAEFIGYARSITLTPAQRQIRDHALSGIPAPCCGRFSMATCCCPCNLAKSVWGLSSYLIVRGDAREAEVQKTALGWIRFVNAKGFTGKVCDSAGGCARRFADDGCGGMDERNLSAAR